MQAEPAGLMYIFLPIAIIISIILLLLKADNIASLLRKVNKRGAPNSKVLQFRGKKRRLLPWQNPWFGSILTKVIAPGVVLAVLGLIIFAWFSAGQFVPMLIIPSLILYRLLTAIGKSLGIETTEDDRTPIVYLREFNGEGSAAQIGQIINNSAEPSPEECLQKALLPIGPLVGLGKPGTWLKKAGATRIYVGDEEWLREATKLINRSRLVLIQVGDSEDLLKEIAIAVRMKTPESILIYLKGKENSYSGSAFIKAASTLRFPDSTQLENGLFLWFTPLGEPIVLKARRKLSLTLKPQVLLDMESALHPVVQYFSSP